MCKNSLLWYGQDSQLHLRFGAVSETRAGVYTNWHRLYPFVPFPSTPHFLRDPECVHPNMHFRNDSKSCPVHDRVAETELDWLSVSPGATGDEGWSKQVETWLSFRLWTRMLPSQ